MLHSGHWELVVQQNGREFLRTWSPAPSLCLESLHLRAEPKFPKKQENQSRSHSPLSITDAVILSIRFNNKHGFDLFSITNWQLAFWGKSF